MSITLPYNFEPRPYQLPILSALDKGVKRAVWCAHRRSGKDVTIFNWVIKKLMTEVCGAFYIMPSYAQGKKVIWDAVNNDGFRILNYCPKEIIETINQQEMKIRLVNGSLFQVIGSENIDSLMGTNPKIVVFSEYALQSPAAWDFIRPILKVNGGVAVFISTPRGKNHFYDLWNIARDQKDWFYQSLTIEDTGVLTKEDIDQEIAEGMSQELAQQEYWVSFDRGVEGSYYGKLIDKGRQEGRIGRVFYDTRSNVHTAWDIGFGDSTSITFWQDVGSETRIIDFYENHGEGIAHYAKVLQNKPYVYGTHYFPHDAGSGSIQTGKTLQQVAREVGINSTVLDRDDFSVGIEAVRSLLSTCYIDDDRCKHLVKCLENYHKKYNDKMECYSDTPVHDWSSHGADSIRYLAMARQKFGKGVSSLTPDTIKEMRRRNLGY